MGLRVIDHLKQAEVNLKSKEAQTGHFLQLADDKKLIASRKQKGLISVFKEITAIGDDGQLLSLAALQVDGKYFLAPKKPKDVSKVTELELRLKEVKASEIFDKKVSEIVANKRKYWFLVKTVGDAQVYESLAYPGFYVSVEGQKVLMRKNSEDFPDDPNYHIYVMPSLDKDHGSNAGSYATATTTTLTSGYDDGATARSYAVTNTVTAFVTADDRAIATAATDPNVASPEAGIPVDVTEELEESAYERVVDCESTARACVDLEERSEIKTFCGSNGPDAEENTVKCEQFEKLTLSSQHDNQIVTETEIIKEEIITKNSVETRDSQNGLDQLPRDVIAENGPPADDTVADVIFEEPTLDDSDVNDKNDVICKKRTSSEKEITTDECVKHAADDSGTDVILIREEATDIDDGELKDSCKKRTSSENGLTNKSRLFGKEKRGTRRRPFWSKIFSCVSSRSTDTD